MTLPYQSHDVSAEVAEQSDFIMVTKRRVLIPFQDKSFVVRIEIFFFLLAVGADSPLSYSMAINCQKKIPFQIWLSRGTTLFLFSSPFLEQCQWQTEYTWEDLPPRSLTRHCDGMY